MAGRPAGDEWRCSRRQVLGAGLLGTGAVAAGLSRGSGLARRRGRLLERLLAVPAPAVSSLTDLEHVVVLMQENRSFDHYFGTLSTVRGWSDPVVPTQSVGGVAYPVWDQFGYRPGVGPTPSRFLQPFELRSDPPAEDGQTTNDITHDWGPQHRSWDGGAMDDFLRVHLAADGDANGILTIGCFTRRGLPFYALADAFTVCDGYHCSVLWPTDRPLRHAPMGDHAAALERGRGELEDLPGPDIDRAALPGDAVRRAGAEPLGLAPLGHR